MIQKETIDPGQISLLGIDRIFRDAHHHQKTPIQLWKGFAQMVFRVGYTLVDHFISSRNRAVIGLQRLRAKRPIIPIETAGPARFQQMTIQQAQGIYFLPELPGRNLRLMANGLKPILHIFRRPVLESNPRFVGYELLNMFLIPGLVPFRNTKNAQNFEIASPECLDLMIRGNRDFHAINPCKENIMRKHIRFGSITKYSSRLYNTPNEPAV